MISETQILTAVIGYLNEKSKPFSKITAGGNSDEGITAEIAPGYARSVYLDCGVFQRLPILLLVRHKKHQTAMETAFTLAETVRKISKKSKNIHGSVAGISMGNGPEFVQRSGADFIYSLIFNIDYLTKGN